MPSKFQSQRRLFSRATLSSSQEPTTIKRPGRKRPHGKPVQLTSFNEECLTMRRKKQTAVSGSIISAESTKDKVKSIRATVPSPGIQLNPKGRAKVTDESIKSLECFPLFASCLPGLEPILYEEITSLGFEPEMPSKQTKRKGNRANARKNNILTPARAHTGAGGISFTVDSVESIMKCHLHLGTSTHILLRCGDPFKARGMEELRRKVSKMLFWKQYMSRFDGDKEGMSTLNIRVSASKSRLYHTGGIAERVEQGIYASLGIDDKGKIDTDELNAKDDHRTVNLVVRVKDDFVQISVDTSANPLHRRGYRLQGAKSPLREDLAYAFLRGSGWGSGDDRLFHLLDPMCGSGTIAIEGAAIAAGLPPGRLRPEPLNGSSLANGALWKHLISNAEGKVRDVGMCAFGSDRDKGAISACNSNAERAGVSDLIQFKACALKSTPWLSPKQKAPDKILIATNPPFGLRSSTNRDVYPLYKALADCYRNVQTDAAALSIIAHNVDLLRKSMAGEDSEVLFSTKHGGLSVAAMQCVNWV